MELFYSRAFTNSSTSHIGFERVGRRPELNDPMSFWYRTLYITT